MTLIIFASCTKKPEESKYPGANKLPFETSFSLDKGGEELEFEIDITEQKLYSFGVMFKANDKIPNDSAVLRKLVGNPRRDKNNKYVDLGVPLAVQLQIISLDLTKAKFEFDKTTSEVVLESGGWDTYNKKFFTLGWSLTDIK